MPLSSLSSNLGSCMTLPFLSHDPYTSDILRSGTIGQSDQPVVKPIRAVVPRSQPLRFDPPPQLPPPLESKVLISAIGLAHTRAHLTFASLLFPSRLPSPEICSRFWGMWTHAFSAAVRIFICLPRFCLRELMLPSSFVRYCCLCRRLSWEALSRVRPTRRWRQALSRTLTLQSTSSSAVLS